MTEKIFNSLYNNINGSKISWQARNKMSDEETEHLIYGEISYNSMTKIYSAPLIKKYFNTNKNFCDLGSGTGRIVFSTALLYNNLNSYCGVELLKELYDTSTSVLKNFSNINQNLSRKISFINDNFFNIDLSKFDIIFMHYPMKNAEDLYLQLEEKMIKELKKDTIIISAIRKLKNIDIFPLIDKQTIEADYGETTMYYHLKYK